MRARQHAEFLAGEHARKDGYLGGVALQEEEDGEEADLSSMPMRTAPLPSPPPKHPFRGEPKDFAQNVSPNVGVDPEVTRPSVRVGGVMDWSAPVV